MKESQDKLAGAQNEMMSIIKDGRTSAEKIIAKAGDEAEKIKMQKLTETEREINRMKDEAFTQLKAEVASLVMQATEKVLDAKLDSETHKKLIESSIQQVTNN